GGGAGGDLGGRAVRPARDEHPPHCRPPLAILGVLRVPRPRQYGPRRSHFERPVAYLKLELAKGSNHQDKGRGFYQKIKPRNTKAPPVRLRFSMVSESSALRKLSRNGLRVLEADFWTAWLFVVQLLDCS